MFHYTTRNMAGAARRGSSEIQVGDWVRSEFRAPWQGVVLELNPNGGIATVQQVLTKRGVRIRKPQIVKYHVEWFCKIEKKFPE